MDHHHHHNTILPGGCIYTPDHQHPHLPHPIPHAPHDPLHHGSTGPTFPQHDHQSRDLFGGNWNPHGSLDINKNSGSGLVVSGTGSISNGHVDVNGTVTWSDGHVSGGGVGIVIH